MHKHDTDAQDQVMMVHVRLDIMCTDTILKCVTSNCTCTPYMCTRHALVTSAMSSCVYAHKCNTLCILHIYQICREIKEYFDNTYCLDEGIYSTVIRKQY